MLKLCTYMYIRALCGQVSQNSVDGLAFPEALLWSSHHNAGHFNIIELFLSKI